MTGDRPIVIFKKVALNFPPLEQGPGRQVAAWHLLLAYLAQPQRAGTCENFGRTSTACIQTKKSFREANGET